jgi:uncharacterized protein YndB with AHSA1/START domain
MPVILSRIISAPIDEVFSFFDDPANTMAFNQHAERVEVIDIQPDGRRTFNISMNSGAKRWTQTIEQVLREPSHRLVTRGGSWTTDRERWLLTITTDRGFSREGNGTRVDVTIGTDFDQPFRHPAQAIRNWLGRGTARAEFERQLGLIAERLEAHSRA